MTNNWTSLHYLSDITLGRMRDGRESPPARLSQHNRNGSQIELTQTIDRFDGEVSHAILHTISMDIFVVNSVWVVVAAGNYRWHWAQLWTAWDTQIGYGRGLFEDVIGKSMANFALFRLSAVWKFDWIAWNIWIWVEYNYYALVCWRWISFGFFIVNKSLWNIEAGVLELYECT